MPRKNMDFHTETGRLSLDWIATLGDRGGSQIERIAEPADLKRWSETVAKTILVCAPDDGGLEDAKNLRTAIISVLDRLYSNAMPAAKDIHILNTFAALPPPTKQLDNTGRMLAGNSGLSLRTMLGVIARDAIDLFSGDSFDKIKLCAADDCSVYFVDHSRPGKRRWCSMGRCGNRAKKKTFLERSALRTTHHD